MKVMLNMLWVQKTGKGARTITKIYDKEKNDISNNTLMP